MRKPLGSAAALIDELRESHGPAQDPEGTAQPPRSAADQPSRQWRRTPEKPPRMVMRSVKMPCTLADDLDHAVDELIRTFGLPASFSEVVRTAIETALDDLRQRRGSSALVNALARKARGSRGRPLQP